LKKTAVILFNLGGPDKPEAIKPFLFNLFNDPAIIRLPFLLRQCVAWIISSRREKTAQEIYGKMGGASPILKNTKTQADALQKKLGEEFKVFIAMRYWHPFIKETVEDVAHYKPDEIILLPLYPQFSTTTTGSSLKEWSNRAQQAQLLMPTKRVCCYPQNAGLIEAIVRLTRAGYEKALASGQKPRLLFSAHGLPEKIIEAGDPYVWQCEQTVKAIITALALPEPDFVLCYQSRVGPLKWVGPATDEEVQRAGKDKTPLVVVPIAFVSEHSETLVELDIEYRELAHKAGVPLYECVKTVGASDEFIDGLVRLVKEPAAARLCPEGFIGCCQTT